MPRHAWLVVCILVALPGAASAQLVPGRHQIMAQAGPHFATNRLLKARAVYPTYRSTAPFFAEVATDIKLDPGLFTGVRYVYNLTRRLQVEGEFGIGLTVLAIRQLEIRPDAKGADQPQFETTTLDAHVLQYFLNLTYYLGNWSKAHPYVTFGVGDHNLDLLQKGQVNPDPVHDGAVMGGLGLILPATERLGIRLEVRNYMYNFQFDNQFVDPMKSREILFRRPDLIKTTRAAGARFQNDLACSLGFLVYPF